MVALLLTALPLRAQTFEQTSGPPGAALEGVAEFGGDVIVSGGGIGAFTFDGTAWTTQPVALRLGALFRAGETLFAHYSSELYRSTDGVSWESAWNRSPAYFTIAGTDGDSLLVIARDSLFITGDGLTWRSVIRGRVIVDAEGEATGAMLLGPRAAARTPDGALWVGASDGMQSGVFRSTDAVTWQFVSPSEFLTAQSLYVTASGELFAILSNQVYRYDEAAEMWESLASELGELFARGFVETGGTLFVHGFEGVTAALYRRGATAWTAVPLPASRVVAISPGEDALYVAGDDRLFRGPGDGSWTPIDDGLLASYALPYALGGDVVAFTPRGWVRSTDEGTTWVEAAFPNIDRVFDFDGVVFGSAPDDVYRSTDGGATWETVNEGIDPGVFHQRRFRAMAAHEGTYYGGLYSSRAIEHGGGEVVGGVYRSTDGGSSWALFGSGFPLNTNGALAGVALLASTDAYLIAVTESGVLRIPHDGTTWEPILNPSDFNRPLFLVATGDRLFLATFRRVLVSTDDGATWTEIADGLPSDGFSLTLSVVGDDVFVLLRPLLLESIRGIYRLDGNGWVDTGVEVPAWVQTSGTATVDDLVFVGTANHGVWRASLDATVASEPAAVAVSAPALAPAFPNPTRGRATLLLSLPEPADVRVEVFDVQGRRVAVLHDGRMEAGVNHALELDAAGLAAGVYLVRATGDGVLLDRRVTVVR